MVPASSEDLLESAVADAVARDLCLLEEVNASELANPASAALLRRQSLESELQSSRADLIRLVEARPVARGRRGPVWNLGEE
jgi:hypothetical protein